MATETALHTGFDAEAFLRGEGVISDEAPHEGDEQLFVTFSVVPMVDAEQTRAQQRPVYRDVEHIHIMIPGSRDEVYDVLTDDYRRRFRSRYDKWKAKSDAPINGYPLSEWPAIGASQVKELEPFKIRTVEQLAKAPDLALQRMGPIFPELAAKARGFLDSLTGDKAKAEAERARLETLEAERKLQQDEINELRRMVEELTAPKAEKRQKEAA